MLEDYDWTSYISKRQTKHLSDEQVKEMVRKLTSAVQKVCWEYGIHN